MNIQTESGLPDHPEIIAKDESGAWQWQPLHHALPVTDPAWLMWQFRLAGFHPGQLPAVCEHYEKADAPPERGKHYPAHIKEALDALRDLDKLTVEVIGTWVWAFDKREAHTEALQAAGFRFSARKSRWYLKPPACAKPGLRSGEGRSNAARAPTAGALALNDLRGTYGSEIVVQ